MKEKDDGIILFSSRSKEKKHKKKKKTIKKKKMQKKEGAYVPSLASRFGMKCSTCLLLSLLHLG
jgi:hypothetical protein